MKTSTALKLLAAIILMIAVILGTKKGGLTRAASEKTDFAMGTVVNVKIYGIGNTDEQAAKAIRSIKRLDQTISWRKDSDLAKLNSSYEVGKKNEIDKDLYEAISKAYEICKASDGALDITIRPLANLWNIEEASNEDFKVPTEDEIKEALQDVGYDNIIIEEDGVIIKKEGMIIDLGSVGKGYALDIVKKQLDRDKVGGANVSVGGSILVYGRKPTKENWRVGIRNPKGTVDDYIGFISIEPNKTTFISTSGDYEKYIEKDGKKYHHILNPKTGVCAESEYASVSIICDNGLVSDGLSTACFILGYEKSLPLLEKYNASAIFIDKNNEVKIVGDVKFFSK